MFSDLICFLYLHGQLSLAPLVALVTGDCKQSCTEFVERAGVNIQHSDVKSIHVIPECQTLAIGSRVLRTQ